jgi:hypothetical protein
MLENFKIEKRNTKVFMIKTKNKVIKIPYALNSWKEIRKERAIIKEVQKDISFSSHLIEYKYIFGCPITARLSPIKEVDNGLVKKYFQKAFSDSERWEKKPLRYLLDLDFFLDFVPKYIPDSYNRLVKFLDSIQIPRSSAHSDFHQKNILVKNGKLYFVDWSRYKQNSSKYFDLLDFYIYQKGKKYEPWMQVWSREYNQIPDAIFGVKISKEYFLAYGVWRTVEELKKFVVENGMDKYKRKKYAVFITILAEKVSKTR